MESQLIRETPNDPHPSAAAERSIFEALHQNFARLHPRQSPSSISPQRQSKSNIDLRELEYASDYDPHLMCPICHVPFIEPIRLKCDHVFCNTCFVEYTAHPNNTRCPSCRAPLEKSSQEQSSVPRLLVNMCDDLQVKCPYQQSGCSAIIPRGHVQHHADNQCDWRPVRCPDESCDQTLPWKYRDQGGCRHGLIRCERCERDVPEWKMDIHLTQDCQSHSTECDECGSTDLHEGGLIHHDNCSKDLVGCSASEFGCPVKSSSASLHEHEERCIFKALMPTLQKQALKLETLQTNLEREKIRNENLESGNQRLWDIFTRQLPQSGETHSPAISRSNSNSQALIPSIANEGIAARPWIERQMLSEPNSMSVQSSQVRGQIPNEDHQHLLSLQESLCTQVSNLVSQVTNLDNSLATVDARQSMALMNETLRIKEELAHLNGAVHTIRSQMAWLLNNRHAQMRGRDGIGTTAGAPTGTVPGGIETSSSMSTSLGGSGSGTGTGTGTRPSRRSSSGNSSQERVKL